MSEPVREYCSREAQTERGYPIVRYDKPLEMYREFCSDCGKPLAEIPVHEGCAPTLLDHGDGHAWQLYSVTWGGEQFEFEVNFAKDGSPSVAVHPDPGHVEMAAADYLRSWLDSCAGE